MAKGKRIDLVTCLVKLGGDRDSTVFKGPHSPVTYPEAVLLRHVHGGEDAVTDIKPALDGNGKPRHAVRSSTEERQRLSEIYGNLVFDVFPGRARPINMPLTIADDADLDTDADLIPEDAEADPSPFDEEPPAPARPPVRRKAS